jgi:hypothetical protein
VIGCPWKQHDLDKLCLQCPSVFYFLMSILIFPIHPILIPLPPSFLFISCPSISHLFLYTLFSRCFHHPSSPVRHHPHSLHNTPHFLHFSSFHLKLFPSRHHPPALQIFNACKLFSPNLYLANDDERTRIIEEWFTSRKHGLSQISLYLKLGSLQVPLQSGQSMGLV